MTTWILPSAAKALNVGCRPLLEPVQLYNGGKEGGIYQGLPDAQKTFVQQ